ncbi:MAG: hypothetical protein GF331_11360 [Chitinivibrionales bacterium]|nr:hypothetical protein [Chitinivibrionales bacterium]
MNVNVRGHGMLRMPDFFIIGAAKSGTTSLHRYLEQHPGVCMAARKESWFFSSNFSGLGRNDEVNTIQGMITDIRAYSALFSGARPGQLLGEASPSCLYTHRTTIGNIRSIYAENQAWRRLRFIIILRNPVDRTWAQYRTHLAWQHEDLPFEQAIERETIRRRLSHNLNPFYDYVGFGMYADQVAAYLSAFGRDSVRVFLFEDLVADPVRLCREVFEFIGVDTEYTPPKLEPRNAGLGESRAPWFTRFVRSSSGFKSACARVVPLRARDELKGWLIKTGARSPKSALGQSSRRKLAAIFADDIMRLQQTIDRDLVGWLFPPVGP